MDLSISRYGISDALQAEFTMLREVQTVSGKLKFSRKSVDLLAQILVCRNYGHTCFEVAHLCWAIVHHAQYKNQFENKRASKTHNVTSDIGSPLLDYFWVEQVATKNTFVAYFADPTLVPTSDANDDKKDHQFVQNLREDGSVAYSLIDSKLCLNINGHEFSLHGGRANFWACILEWLVCVSPNVLELIESSLENKGQNAINELASRLQQIIYAYLSEHLPPAKLQKRYRQIDTWHQENAAKNSDGGQVLDNAILLFWQQHKHLEGFTKYSFVVSEHLAYMQAKDIVQTQATMTFTGSFEDEQDTLGGQSASVDWESEQGVNESFYAAFSAHQSDKLIDLDMLSNKPKVFKQEQVNLLELVALYPQYLQRILWSWLRSMVFAKYQNQLIQAKRKNTQINIENIKAEPSDYAQVCSQTSKLIAHNQFTLLALVDILLSISPKEGLFLLAKLSRHLPHFKEHAKHLEELFSKGDVFNDATLPSAQLKHPWFNTMLKQCKQARSKINRLGFTEKTMLTEDEYLDTASQLMAVNKVLIRTHSSIVHQNLHSQENFCSDRLIFISKLKALYCQDSEQ